MRTNRQTILPRKIDFYIISEILGPFFGGLLLFTFIFLMLQALRLATLLIEHGVPVPILLKMVFLLVLNFSPFALPIAFLIAMLVGFGRLSADSELVAMKACGISTHRMAVPALTLAILVTVLSLGLNLSWVPKGERMLKTLLNKVASTQVVSSIKQGTFTSGFFDLLIYADEVDKKTNELKGVFIYDEREPKTPLTVIAKRGQIVTLEADSEFASAVVLHLFDGNIHRNNIEEYNYQKIDFADYQLYLSIDEAAANSVTKPKMYSYRQLKEQIDRAHRDTQDWIEYRLELWRRWAVALSPLVFVFLGIGFGTIRTRSVRSSAALVAIIAIIGYWGLLSFGAVLAKDQLLHPGWAMHMPNIALSLIALWAYRKSAW